MSEISDKELLNHYGWVIERQVPNLEISLRNEPLSWAAGRAAEIIVDGLRKDYRKDELEKYEKGPWGVVSINGFEEIDGWYVSPADAGGNNWTEFPTKASQYSKTDAEKRAMGLRRALLGRFDIVKIPTEQTQPPTDSQAE